MEFKKYLQNVKIEFPFNYCLSLILHLQEEPIEIGTDGKFMDKRFFYCPGGRGFFIKLSCCKKDSRFMSPQAAEGKVIFKEPSQE